ncbi:5'/3'-nucleotidase SurE [Fluoribacter dumoffii]|uniref:5'/3'-nucleotidase SurE n=1 Tax=Fluoribacter dumoffii TaxID=463 RepID=UPI00026C7D51|nr:5'/3'-nucleotidase SurE [Fluoribacter dumoffii]
MNVLISNDDGVFAPGINILAAELASCVNVEVVAPDRNRSGASNSLTLSRPIKVKTLENGYYSVEGTPTDCVHLAITGLLNTEFDMVVSGINDGANLGDDTLYSGTVAAAVEGRYLGLPALAISMVGDNIQHYETAAIIVRHLVMKLSKHRLPSQTILNINVPDVPINQLKGLQVTRLGTRHSAEPIVKDRDPRGRPIYWIGLPGPQADAGPGTDFYAISEGYVSITPLHLDMTNYKMFDQLASWLNGIQME